MSQYALNLSLPAIFADENFAVSESNEAAHTALLRWPQWPAHAFYLYGPQGSGKSHLGHIWARRAKAHVMPASALAREQVAGMQGHWLIENIDTLADEQALFHLYNQLREQNGALLLTGCTALGALPLTLPDLASRLKSLPSAGLNDPDDALVAAILRKLFADRQLLVDEESINYLVPRIERSYSKINSLIASLDQQALERHKKLSIPFIRQVLALQSS